MKLKRKWKGDNFKETKGKRREKLSQQFSKPCAGVHRGEIQNINKGFLELEKQVNKLKSSY